MTKFRRIAAIAAATAVLASASVSSAQAQITIGQLPASVPNAVCEAGPIDLMQFSVSTGGDYVVTENGTMTSWSTYAAAGPNQTLTFKLFRPSSSGGFTVVAHDTRTLSPGVVNTFKVNIPVKLNDVIGLNDGNASATTPNACEFEAGKPLEDKVHFFSGNALDGGGLGTELEEATTFRANVRATFLQPPEINIFGKVSLGSIAGGASVVIKGNHFEEVTGVSFGGVPATKFTVNDEHQLTAIAPPGKTLDEIPATVTTLAGTATAPSRFAYSGCAVPKLTGKKLSAAKAKIKAAGCKLGKVKRVRGPRSKRGKVVKQSPKPGGIGAPETKVSVKVGK